MKPMSRRLVKLSPRSISRRRIAGPLQGFDGLLPAEQSRSGGRGDDELKGRFLASRRRQDICHLRIRCAAGRLTDLTCEIVVRSFYAGSACRPCRYALAQSRIALAWALKNPTSQGFGK
jgi:hypothetical protein